jgi:putative ABC transport system substrate-binding protein
MCNVSHPVEAGYVASLAHPGGNITGVSNQSPDLQGKQIELLQSVGPDIKKVGVLWSPHNAGSALAFKQMHVIAHERGVELVSLPVDAPADLGHALEQAQREGVQALWVHGPPPIQAGTQQIAAWAIENRVMATSAFDYYTRGGLLWSYGADGGDLLRITGTFVDRILRGANPAELPVEQPTRFFLVINLKTAKAIGVTIPQSVLLRADEVIE